MGCYTIWLTNQEEILYYTKIDQLFVKIERNIKASRKRSYRSEESNNVLYSIETELESLLHANFPADLVTERNRLEKAGEKAKQILEERRKQKWKKNHGSNWKQQN